MTRVIRPEALDMEKLWSPISNQLYIEGWNWKNKFNYTKEFKNKN
jgi:hypothetical protein